jgi:hypothetical protein
VALSKEELNELERQFDLAAEAAREEERAKRAERIRVEELDSFITVISEIIENRVDPLVIYEETPTEFRRDSILELSIRDYLERFKQYSKLEKEDCICMLIYMDRFLKRNPGYILSECNIHLLLSALIVVALKFVRDDVFNNVSNSRVGSVSLAELNKAEIQLLYMLDFDLDIRPDQYRAYEKELIKFQKLGVPTKYQAPTPRKALEPSMETTVRFRFMSYQVGAIQETDIRWEPLVEEEGKKASPDFESKKAEEGETALLMFTPSP